MAHFSSHPASSWLLMPYQRDCILSIASWLPFAFSWAWVCLQSLRSIHFLLWVSFLCMSFWWVVYCWLLWFVCGFPSQADYMVFPFNYLWIIQNENVKCWDLLYCWFHLDVRVYLLFIYLWLLSYWEMMYQIQLLFSLVLIVLDFYFSVYGSTDCTPLTAAVIPLKTKFADAYTCQANNLTDVRWLDFATGWFKSYCEKSCQD